MIVILIILMLYPFLMIAILIPLNRNGMLPGTWRYRQWRELEAVKFQVEVSRQQAIASRYRMKENEMLDHQMKALEAPKA